MLVSSPFYHLSIFLRLAFLFSANKSTPQVLAEEKDAKNATSQEILDEVIRKLHLLDTDKRRLILNMLKKPHTSVNGTNNEKLILEDMKTDLAVDDEVETLDMDEPKLGKYKRKRSKYFSINYKYLKRL